MNTQKGFSVVFTLIIILIILSIGGYFLIPIYNEGIFQKMHVESYRENRENNSIQTEQIKVNNSIEQEQVVTVVTPQDSKTNNYKSKFGFGFSFSEDWFFVDDLNNSNTNLKPPYLFSGIITTENKHPIDRAGNVSVLDMTFTDVVAELNEEQEIKDSLTGLTTKSFKGYSYKISNTYGYVLDNGSTTIMIDFRNDTTSESAFDQEFVSEIEAFVRSFYKI